MTSTRNEIRNAIACVVMAMAALLLAWPFAEISFNDDWTWAFTVKQLSQTGHLMYNGWSSPSVIAQAYWGWLWVKCFGFSFNILRVSALPLAAGTVAATYALARRAGLNVELSVFAALTLGLSPLFMPMAASFMSDVPGLFFLLLSMYALARGFETSAARWILFGSIAALVGGSSRQNVWIVPLIVLPYFIWLRRTDRSFIIAGVVSWILVLAGAVTMQHWFSRQPYALPDPPLISYLHGIVRHPRVFVAGVISLAMTTLLLILPAAVAVVRRSHRAWVAVVIFIVIAGVLRLMHKMLFPWMGNILTTTGVLGPVELAGDRPVFFSRWIQIIITISVVGTCSLLLASIGNLKLSNRLLLHPKESNANVLAIVLAALGLIGLELTRCVFDVAYDRHLLMLMPFIIVPLLFWFQNNGLKKMPKQSWALLGIFAVYAIASTQEVSSLARARVATLQHLATAGILGNQVDAGFEHDYWTELLAAGHINDPRLENPPGVYQPNKGPTPHSRVLYRLESGLSQNTIASEFGAVQYLSFLPPFHRTIYIDRFKDPWWLDPIRAATRPANRQMVPKLLLDQYPQRKK